MESGAAGDIGTASNGQPADPTQRRGQRSIAAAQRLWGNRPRNWKLTVALHLVYLAGLVVYGIFLTTDEADSVYDITSRSIDEIAGRAAPDGVTKYVLLDYGFMIAVAGFLLLMLRYPPTSSLRRIREGRATAHEYWKVIGLLAVVVYLVADVVETTLLWQVARDVGDNGFLDPVGLVVRVMSVAFSVKWFAFAAALIAIAARLGRRTPQLAEGASSWGLPNRQPDFRNASQDPDDTTDDGTASQGNENHETENHETASQGTDDATENDEADNDETDDEAQPSTRSSTRRAIESTPEPVPHTETTGAAQAPEPSPSEPHSTLYDSWDPSADRFGIAISGGGIRSASFALGALGELRRRGLLRQARYVTAVSGGSYAASALEHANRKGEPVDTTERRLRRRLGYLLPDTRTSLAGLARVLLGLFVNLWILYLVIFMVARPIGWTIGSPLVQQGLRYDGPVAVDVVEDPDDPDTKPGELETWNDPEKCALETSPETPPTISDEESSTTGFGDTTITLIEFELAAPTQCLVVEHEHSESEFWTIDLVADVDETGLIRVENGVAEIIRQPALEATNPLPVDCEVCQIEWREVAELVDIEVPDLELAEEAEAAIDVETVAELLEPIEPVVVDPDSIVELRGDLDIDVRHWLIPVITGLAMLVAWIYAGTNRAMRSVESRRRATFRGRVAAWAFAASLTVFFVLPLLVKTLPETITGALETGPTEEQLSSVSWLPAGVNPLLAWPVLAVTTVTSWVQERRAATKKQTAGKDGAKGARSTKRNSAALLSKAITFLTRLAVAVILVLLVVTTSVMQMTTAAINGPFGDYTWISREFFGRRIPWPPDLATWAAVIVVLLLIRSTFAAGSWSLGPYYRRQLRWAFMGDSVGHDAFDGSDEADEADDESDDEDRLQPRDRAGCLDDTAAELVICAAANVTGADRAPTGRHAVSFSASRSWIGGPEIGWMPTDRYLSNLGDARKQDVTVSAMTAVSGAAASPAMGKQSLGPIGAILAVLNVRLGAWLPHPMAVGNLPDPSRPGLRVWKHRPGWPYFVREVLRRHRHESAYLYVSDGGHWENLGLVEALRRGCNTIVVISAAGDGASSHGTFAEAVEIARTDLDIEIRFDDIWKMRPPVGGDTELDLPSGRQFLRQSGDNPEVGRVAPRGWTFGTFTRNGVSAPHNEGQILLIEASMVDELTVDVHAYAESHHEFPDINTGDQFFTHRDFESYRKLGEDLVDRSLRTYTGYKFEQRILALPDPARPRANA